MPAPPSRSKALSPMINAASQRSSIASRPGARISMDGWIPNSRAHSTRTSATEVRELVSIAIERTSDIGRPAYNATDATGPSDAMARSGTIR